MIISENKKVTIKSGLTAFIGNIFGKLISFPVGIYVASVLNPVGYGLLTIISTVIQYMSFFNLGMLSNFSREVPIAYGKNDTDEVKIIYNTIFTNYLITSIVAILVLWILHLFGMNFYGQLQTIHFVTMSFILLFANAESFLYSVLKAEGKFIIFGQYELVSRIFNPAITVVLVFFLGFNGMLLSLIVTHILGFGFILSKIERPQLEFRLNLNKTKDLISTGLMMYLNKIVDTIFFTAIVMVGSSYLTIREVGILSFALGFTSISKIPFATILTVSMDRRIAYEGGKFGEKRFDNYAKFFGSTYVIYLMMLCLFFGIFVIFYMVLVNLFLQEYVMSIPLLIILFFALNFYNARYFMNSYINVTRQMNKRSLILIIGLFINLIFGFLSVKCGLGILGLASVAALSMVVVSVHTIYVVFTQVHNNSYMVYPFLLKILLIASSLSALLYFFKNFTFISYEYDYHNIYQMFLVVIDIVLKCILYSFFVFLLFVGCFINQGVYKEIKSLVSYAFLNFVIPLKRM
jgi:O-antigen/teichoic acid export membrane protein